MTTLALLCGGGIGLGLLLVIRGLVPGRTDLAASVGRWELARGQANRSRTADAADKKASAGLWLTNALTRRGVSLEPLRTDLAITGRTAEAWLATTLVTVVAAFLMPSVLSILATLLGIGTSLAVPLVAGVVLAAAAAIGSVAQLRKEAEVKRDEFVTTLGTYLHLFSMCLAGGRGINEAMVTSASIGRGWAFDMVRDRIGQARRSGDTPWKALGDLGAEMNVKELTDLSSALSLVGDNGARVRSSLRARAATLRRRQLADASAAASSADDSMRVSQTLMGAGFMLLIGFPAAALVLAM